MSHSVGLEGGAAGAGLAMAAAALLAAGLLWTRARPRGPWLLRAAALALIALCGLGAALNRSSAILSKPRLAILIDGGLTMGSKDGGGPSRLERASRWLLRHRAEIEARSEPVLFVGTDRVRRVRFEDLDALSVTPAGFDPAAGLEAALEGQTPQRVWLLSDGPEEAAIPAARAKAPVDVLAVGPRDARATVAVAELQTPDFVFLHSRFPISVQIEAIEWAGGEVIGRLWKDKTMVSEVSLPVRSDYEILQATFAAAAQSLGRERYRVELEGRGGPRGQGIPRASRGFGVEVIRQKHRIMYLAGRPSPGYAHLREMLKADANHELVSFVILRNPENVSPVADHELSLIPFPAQEIFVQNLMQFDMFILEDFAYWRFNLPAAYLDGLRRFVAQGGALLIIGGAQAFAQGGYRGTAIEDILPVALWGGPDDYVPGPFRPKVLTPGHPLVRLGETPEASAALWEELPPLDGFNRFARVRPGATVLLAHPSERTPEGPMPVLAVREHGKGKVMVLGTGSTWRWRLAGGRHWKVGAFYSRFWSRAVQYLSGTLELPRVKFSPLPDRLPPVEPLSVVLKAFDESFRPLPAAQADVKVVWTPPDGRARAAALRETEPGTYSVELTGLNEGAHSLRASVRLRGQPWGEDEARFSWLPRSIDAPLRRRWLQGLAQSAGGRYAELERVRLAEWLAALPPPRTERTVTRTWHLWASPLWLAAAGLLLLAEWIWRRRLGFV